MNKKYEKEVKEKWGETKEYKEFQERENKILPDEVIGQLGIVLSSFSQSLNNNVSPKSPEVQLAKLWRKVKCNMFTVNIKFQLIVQRICSNHKKVK